MSVGWLLNATNIEHIQLLSRFHNMAQKVFIRFSGHILLRAECTTDTNTHTHINWWWQLTMMMPDRRMLSQPRKWLLLLLIKLRCFRFLCVSFILDESLVFVHGILVGFACRIKMIEHCECWISWPKFSLCRFGMDNQHRRIYNIHYPWMH